MQPVRNGVPVGGGEGVACAVLYRARAVAAVVKLPAYGLAVDADNVGIAVVLAVKRKGLVGCAGGLSAMYHQQRFAAALQCPAAGFHRSADGGLPVSSKAALNKGGRALPRFCARSKIPCFARSLKKYFCRVCVSSTCDNEDAAAALGDSEILRVKDAPRDAAFVSKHATCVRPFLPCWDERHIFSGQPAQKTSEGVVFGVEHARDVFPDEDAGRLSVSGANKVNCI